MSVKMYALAEFKRRFGYKTINIQPKKSGFLGTSPVFAIAIKATGEEVLGRAQDTDWTAVTQPSVMVEETVDTTTGEVTTTWCMVDGAVRRPAIASF